MAIDPAGRFPLLPAPLLPQRPTGPTPTENGADPARVQNRGRPAQAELLSETPEEDARRRQANAQRQQPTGQTAAPLNPNAPRGSILDIEV